MERDGEQWVHSSGCSGDLETYGKSRTFSSRLFTMIQRDKCQVGGQVRFDRMDRKAGMA